MKRKKRLMERNEGKQEYNNDRKWEENQKRKEIEKEAAGNTGPRPFPA